MNSVAVLWIVTVLMAIGWILGPVPFIMAVSATIAMEIVFKLG